MLDKILPILCKNARSISKNGKYFLFSTFLENEGAFCFARNKLRDKYEKALEPASYDAVVQGLRLKRDDFVEFLESGAELSSTSFKDFIKTKIYANSSDWIYNRPHKNLFDNLVSDFYKAYESFYLSLDATFSDLLLLQTTKDIYNKVHDVYDEIAQLNTQTIMSDTSKDENLFSEILVWLKSTKLVFRILEDGNDYLDLLIIDNNGFLPSKYYVSIFNTTINKKHVEQLKERINLHKESNQSFLICKYACNDELKTFIENRKIEFMTLSEFHGNMFQNVRSTTFTIGQILTDELRKNLNIESIYIEPQATIITPSMVLGPDIPKEKFSATGLARRFLNDVDDKIMFIFGGYGTGKSAFCAHLAHLAIKKEFDNHVAYVPLGQINSEDNIEKITKTASNTIRAFYGNGFQLVILDGLDEMPNAISSRDRKYNLLRVLEACKYVDKLIITSRTPYFKGLHEFWRLFGFDDASKAFGKPNISIMLMHNFNNDQIDSYLEQYGTVVHKSEYFKEEYLKETEKHGSQTIFRSLAKNPLYLSHMTQVDMWNNPNIQSIADVVGRILEFSFRRDRQKGEARWKFLEDDRKRFMRDFSWWMFNNNMKTVNFSNFNKYIEDKFPSTEQNDNEVISLDLLTTGLFASFGQVLHFSLPIFFDYFVASKFVMADFSDEEPERVPTSEQIKFILAMSETDAFNEDYWKSDRPDDWLKRLGIDIEDASTARNITISCAEILFRWEGELWPKINIKEFYRIRALIREGNAENYSVGDKLKDGAILFTLHLENKHGLHLRTLLYLSNFYQDWKRNLESNVNVTIHNGGDRASLNNFTEMTMIAARGGESVYFVFENCTKIDADSFMERFAKRRSAQEWSTNFREVYDHY